MKTDLPVQTLALAGALMLAGCGKPPDETQPVADAAAAPPTAEAQLPAPPADTNPTTATDEPLLGGAGFARKSLASPFAQADKALKEGYDSALLAFQVGDYPRAANELRVLGRTTGLTPEQVRAVQDLLAKTLEAAPEAAPADTAAPDMPQSPITAPGATTNETRPGGAEFTRKSLASPFAQAGQALKESYDSALLAVQVGDYDRAVTELKVLAGNPDLTPEQQQAVRDLLAQTIKGSPEPAPSPGADATNAAGPGTAP